MELGNMIFGNSRGSHPLPRGAGWEEELIRLFDACDSKRDSSWREYGVSFKNEIFETMPYYWGECECGYDEREWKWCDENEHEAHCYQTKLCNTRDVWLVTNSEPDAQMMNTSQEEVEPGMTLISMVPASSPSADAWREWYAKKKEMEDALYDRLCAEFGLDREFGCAVHCTCDHETRWQTFVESDGHDENCGVVKPNFYHKPSGVSIQWYKYPLRDSYISHELILKEFAQIIDECIESV